MQETTGALILAAGKGTRMPSPRPKALQTLLGESMLALVLEETTKLSGLVGIRPNSCARKRNALPPPCRLPARLCPCSVWNNASSSARGTR